MGKNLKEYILPEKPYKVFNETEYYIAPYDEVDTAMAGNGAKYTIITKKVGDSEVGLGGKTGLEFKTRAGARKTIDGWEAMKKETKVDESLIIKSEISDYEPWSGAVDFWNEIVDADKVEALEAILEDLYPEGLTMTELNDIIWFEQDWVREMIGLEEEPEEEDEEIEFDRRAVEKEYELEDGELDDMSIRDAEEWLDLEEGELDRFIIEEESCKEGKECKTIKIKPNSKKVEVEIPDKSEVGEEGHPIKKGLKGGVSKLEGLEENKKIKVTNIVWDESEGKIEKPEEMPKELVLDYNDVVANYCREGELSKACIDDAIGAETGWFTLDFDYEILDEQLKEEVEEEKPSREEEILNNLIAWACEHDNEFVKGFVKAGGFTEEEIKKYELEEYMNDDEEVTDLEDTSVKVFEEQGTADEIQQRYLKSLKEMYDFEPGDLTEQELQDLRDAKLI